MLTTPFRHWRILSVLSAPNEVATPEELVRRASITVLEPVALRAWGLEELIARGDARLHGARDDDGRVLAVVVLALAERNPAVGRVALELDDDVVPRRCVQLAAFAETGEVGESVTIPRIVVEEWQSRWVTITGRGRGREAAMDLPDVVIVRVAERVVAAGWLSARRWLWEGMVRLEEVDTSTLLRHRLELPVGPDTTLTSFFTPEGTRQGSERPC